LGARGELSVRVRDGYPKEKTREAGFRVSASHAETVERIFDVRFGKSDVLNVSAEMK
jgi:hypothetical protein